MNNKESFFERNRKALIIVGFILTSLAWFVYSIGPQHIPHHIQYYLLNGLFSSGSDTTSPTEAGTDMVPIDTTAVVYANENLEAPMDTVMWLNSIAAGGYIPDDVKEELERVRHRDFSSLIVAQDFPANEEAQAAIIQRYRNEVSDLLAQYDAHIKIGKCFSAPLQSSDENGNEIARVTAMVCAFNSKNENLRNIQRPLDTIYDFVKFESDPNTWYITDFSQNIPYDYALNK
jgi:hypothetical protein